MYEELSRLLAGELDAVSEATLRARIADDPALAHAWAQMSALPDLLGGLSLEGPPPALAARLADMALDIDADFAAFEDELRDPADETMDPEAEVLNPSVRARAIARAPATAQGREAFLDRLLTEAREDAGARMADVVPLHRAPPRAPAPVRSVGPARTGGSARRVGVTVLVGAMAMAAGLFLGVQAPNAPSAPTLATEVAVSEGTTTVDGSVDLRAGDVHVRVDGRARVKVEPDWFASREVGTATVVVVGGAQPASLAVATPESGTEAEVSPLTVAPVRHNTTDEGTDAAYVATVGPAAQVAAAAPRMLVTIEVERGAAVVDPTGRAVTVEAGESRTFDPRGAEIQVPGVATAEPVPSGSTLPPITTVEGHQSKRQLVTLGGGLVHPAGDPDAQIRPANEVESGPPEAYGLLGDEDRMSTALAAVPGAALLDIDCTETPCVAVFDYDGEDPTWRERLGDALSAELAMGVTLTGSAVVVEGWSVELLAVSVDHGKPEGAVMRDEDEHAHRALAGIERELTE